jgi:hypothetical protein
MPWPDLLGARDTLGRIVVGRKRSQSKWSNTRFVLFNPRCKVATPPSAFPVQTAGRFAWARDAANHAILVEGLREVVNRKVEVPFERGASAIRVVDTTLVMYEDYRGTLWPRYWWPLHLSAPGWAWALNEAILMETLRPDTLVAFEDNRQAVSVNPHLPHDWDWQDKPRWTGDLNDFIDQIIAKREETA